MPQLANALTLDATFYDLDGEVLNSSFQAVGLAGDDLPFQVRRVFLKTEVPCGAEFEVVLKVEDREPFRFRGRMPFPAHAQDEAAHILEGVGALSSPGASGRFPKQAEVVQGFSRLGNFEADVWGRFCGQPNGFVEFELHIGQAGINTPKCVLRSFIWARTKA